MGQEGEEESSVKDNLDSLKGESCKTAKEYFSALEKWLQEAYMIQSVAASFPYMFMYNQMLPNIQSSTQPFINNGFRPPPSGQFQYVNNNTNFVGPGVPGAENGRQQNVQQPVNQARQFSDINGIEYRIPATWKRVIAEFLDFVILLFVRLAITFVAVDFDIIDLDKYDLDILQRNVKMDYKLAMEMTSEILLLEIIHRLVVCLFEAFWLRGGMGPRLGGATPGKALLGIRVVLCERVTEIVGRPPEVVMVYPGTDPGFFWAFSRSLIKNIILAIMFPICFVIFLFKHNRTGYDLLCKTIVVEDVPHTRN